MAAPWRTSQEALNKSTSNNLTTPSQIQDPGITSRALDCAAAFGEIAPPLEGSITTFSGDIFPDGAGLLTRELERPLLSEAIKRALKL